MLGMVLELMWKENKSHLLLCLRQSFGIWIFIFVPITVSSSFSPSLIYYFSSQHTVFSSSPCILLTNPSINPNWKYFLKWSSFFSTSGWKCKMLKSQKPLLYHTLRPGTDLLHTNSYVYMNSPHCICHFPSFVKYVTWFNLCSLITVICDSKWVLQHCIANEIKMIDLVAQSLSALA